MENGKQYVYMNHFTLGEKQQPVKKNHHAPPLPGYFPLNHSYIVFSFSIFQLRNSKKSKSKSGLRFHFYVAGQSHRHSRNFVSDRALEPSYVFWCLLAKLHFLKSKSK
jgi:hypothetical protein